MERFILFTHTHNLFTSSHGTAYLWPIRNCTATVQSSRSGWPNLLRPGHLRYVKVFGQAVEMHVEQFYPLLVGHLCLLHDAFVLLQIDGSTGPAGNEND